MSVMHSKRRIVDLRLLMDDKVRSGGVIMIIYIPILVTPVEIVTDVNDGQP